MYDATYMWNLKKTELTEAEQSGLYQGLGGGEEWGDVCRRAQNFQLIR